MGFLRTGRKQSLPFVVLEDKKKNLENYPASPWFLGKCWNNNSRKLFPGTWKTGKWLWVVIMNLWRRDHVWPIQLPPMMRWLARKARGEQQALLVLYLARLPRPPHPYRQVWWSTCWVRGCWVKTAAAALLGTKGCDQQHKFQVEVGHSRTLSVNMNEHFP